MISAATAKTAKARKEVPMDERCWCGERLRGHYESWVCARCARPCCPACSDRDGRRATCLACRGRESVRTARAG